jgi:hypothetical protein
MSRAVLSAGWRPRNLHDARMRRPAMPEGPAVPAAGWRLHQGEPEPGDEDKIPPTTVSPKVAWPQQDRQGRRTGMTQATSGLHQPASNSLPHERIRGKREGICLPDAGPRGERRFIKCNRQTRIEEGQKITPKTQPRESRQPDSQPPNLSPDPRLYKGVWILRLERSDLLLPPLDRTARGAL